MNITIDTSAHFGDDGALTSVKLTARFDGIADKSPTNERRLVTSATLEWQSRADEGEPPYTMGPSFHGHSIKVNGERRGWQDWYVMDFAQRHTVEAVEVRAALWDRLGRTLAALVGALAS